MSRIGRHPIAIPAGVTVTVSDDNHVRSRIVLSTACTAP